MGILNPFPLTDKKIIKRIKQLAADPGRVRITQRAESDMFSLGMTKQGVCESIIEWVDSGKEIKVIITGKAKGYIGKPAYEMFPEMDGQVRYVKVGLMEEKGRALLIISAHRQEEKR